LSFLVVLNFGVSGYAKEDTFGITGGGALIYNSGYYQAL